MCDADRSMSCADAGVAAAATDVSPPVSGVNLSTTALSRPSRQLRRFDSLPDDVTRYGVADRQGHVILSSTRLLEKLTATLNALSVDCRQAGARNHGNGVVVTSDRYDNSGAASMRDDNPAASYCHDYAKPGIPYSITAVKDHVQLTDFPENVIASNQTDEDRDTEVESLTRLESPTPLSNVTVSKSLTQTQQQQQQQHADDRQCSNGGDVIILDVSLHKGPLGLGFCIDGGLDAPAGPSPITVKRLFKGGSS